MSYVYAHGDGSAGNPYQVWDADDLDGVRDHLTSRFIQMDDIDLSGWNDLSWQHLDGWVPIGEFTSPYFSGVFDGNGFSIKNLYSDGSSGSYQRLGLFSRVTGTCHLKNITIDSPYIRSNGISGSLVGYVHSDWTNAIIIENCIANNVDIGMQDSSGWGGHGGLIGEVDTEPEYLIIRDCSSDVVFHCVAGSYHAGIGGLVGYSGGATYNNCHGKLKIHYQWQVGAWTSSFTGIGGLIGSAYYVQSHIINRCSGYIDADIIDEPSRYQWCIGGLIGELQIGLQSNYRDIVSQCYATGSIHCNRGGDYGGLMGLLGIRQYGQNNHVPIKDCYSRVNISAIDEEEWTHGGFIGGCYISNNISVVSTIKNCYSAGNLPLSITNTGGFISPLVTDNFDKLSLINCYYDKESAGIDWDGAGCPSRTTAEMVYPYVDFPTNIYTNWFFCENGTGLLNDGYPLFIWQIPIWKHDKDHKVNDGYPYFCWWIPPILVSTCVPFLFKVPKWV